MLFERRKQVLKTVFEKTLTLDLKKVFRSRTYVQTVPGTGPRVSPTPLRQRYGSVIKVSRFSSVRTINVSIARAVYIRRAIVHIRTYSASVLGVIPCVRINKKK